jgi:hypothetical protein
MIYNPNGIANTTISMLYVRILSFYIPGLDASRPLRYNTAS